MWQWLCGMELWPLGDVEGHCLPATILYDLGLLVLEAKGFQLLLFLCYILKQNTSDQTPK